VGASAASTSCDAFDFPECFPKTGLGYWAFTPKKLPQRFSRCSIHLPECKPLPSIAFEGFLTTKFALMLKNIILK
jgi:hypothetical protein